MTARRELQIPPEVWERAVSVAHGCLDDDHYQQAASAVRAALKELGFDIVVER